MAASIVYSAAKYRDNSELIDACRRLGYISDSALTLDPTYGLGNFYNVYRPRWLVTGDAHTRADMKLDFTRLPFRSATFGTVIFDPPYKLNGTPSYADRPYGVHTYTRWQDRIALMRLGQNECARVVKVGGLVLTRCMDQVVSGKVRFQSDIMTEAGKNTSLRKIDQLLLLTNPREQPHSRQVHSRRNYSTLLVFQKV